MSSDERSPFLDLIDLAPADGPDSFVGSIGPERHGRTYGGQFLAQALAAGQRTVGTERRVHSVHAYFLRSGDVAEVTHYAVERVRDGRSFAVRSVTAWQGFGDHQREMFRMMASFHTPEPGLEFQPGDRYPVDTVAPPESAPLDYPGFAALHPDFGIEPWDGASRPMEVAYLDPPPQPGGPPLVEPQLMWVRISAPMGADQAAHDAGLAYLADSTLIDQVLLPHGVRWQDRRLTGASLDHAMWFHHPARADEWLLFDQRVESTSGARGLATGRFYSAEGILVATSTQEGLIRWDDTDTADTTDG